MAARDLRTRLARRASRAGVFLTDDLSEQLAVYYELLERWNRKINLTALDDPDLAIDRLLIEPVVASRYLPQGPITLMDVGSGGGSPALPLTLAGGSRISLTMVEAKTRKSAFLREAVRLLALQTATVENSRYEDLLARPELHEHFNAMSIRAVRVEGKLLMTLQAFIKPRGLLLLFRGPSGRDQPPLTPPLEWQTTVPLIEALRSRLSLVTKMSTSTGVPRIIV